MVPNSLPELPIANILILDFFLAGQIEMHPAPNLKTRNLNSAKVGKLQEGSKAKVHTQTQHAACAKRPRTKFKDAESTIWMWEKLEKMPTPKLKMPKLKYPL